MLPSTIPASTVNDGLKELAEAVGVEWWIEGETVNLCRCEHGEEVIPGVR